MMIAGNRGLYTACFLLALLAPAARLRAQAVSADTEVAATASPIRSADARRRPEYLGSSYVPSDSWAYSAFARLQALGHGSSGFANLRPWTRMECSRLTEEVGASVASEGGRRSEAYLLYVALQNEFAPERNARLGNATRGIAMDSVYVRYSQVTGTPLADSYHFGQTLVDDYGRPYGEGANAITGTSVRGEAGPLAFYIRGEYQHAGSLPPYSASVQSLIGQLDGTPSHLPIHTNQIDRGRLLEAYFAWNIRSIQLSFGRQSLDWGPAPRSSLMLGSNAEPIDMVRLTKTSPWKLPGLLAWLGPMRWDAFAGLLAGHHYPGSPAIQGQKISFKPTPNLELGFSRTIVFRPATAGNFVRAFVSFGDKTSTVPGSAADVGDRRGGFDFRYRIPGLRNWVTLYNDALTDDDPSPISAPHRSMMNPGIYLPRLPKLPRLDLRVELPFSDTPEISRYAGRFFYWNGGFHDSYTNNGNLLGSWVGRQGHGTYLRSTYWFSPRNTFQVGYRELSVDREFIPSGGHLRDFNASTTFTFAQGIEFTGFVQHERWNFPVLGPSRSNTTTSFQLTYRPKQAH